MKQFRLTEQEQTLVHAAAREIAAGWIARHGDVDMGGAADDAVKLVIATRDAIRTHNDRAAEAEANLAQHGVELRGAGA